MGASLGTSLAVAFPPPLRGPRRAELALEVREGGGGEDGGCGLPLSPALPRKGGGSAPFVS
ncbi:hypothetical protein SAMN05444050_6069 [Afipia sp. GAS231]|nr:hypothetical protein SAMN05444050_6069 [Afipia sp. GAS231]